MKRVLAFGTFDGIHSGHRAFLREARGYGDHLTVVVAADSVVERLKGRRPKRTLSERAAAMRAEPGVDEVVDGDHEIGAWDVLERVRPDRIALGFDQELLRASLEIHLATLDRRPELVVMRKYERGE